MKIAIGQINTSVGDLDGNTSKISDYYLKAVSNNCDLIAFPELTICGYPIQDQATNHEFLKDVRKKISILKQLTVGKETAMLIGAPIMRNQKIYNAALFIYNGVIQRRFKHSLPNYGVFDEKRVFSSYRKSSPIEFKGHKLGILICEDIWDYTTPNYLASKGAEILICINSSPYDCTKFARRMQIVSTVQSETNLPILYVNQVGGQDGLVFDGASFFVDKVGNHLIKPVLWEESFSIVDTKKSPTVKAELPENIEQIYCALVLGLRDYFQKTGFSNAAIGSSGGIDSALVAVLAADALGNNNVETVMLTSEFTSKESIDDALKLSKNIGCNHKSLSIKETYNAIMNQLSTAFSEHEKDTTEENLQARIRGTILMALSNKFGSLLLATGNKSEYATGYATLYGDMCGAFAPIKDVYKTQVYGLAKWRNKNIPSISHFKKKAVIPENIITKEPTAELRSNQKDSDSLPPYNILDAILYHLIEQNLHYKVIRGYDRKLVKKVNNMLLNSEYKRKQSVIGTKISTRDLSLDRRYPIANKY